MKNSLLTLSIAVALIAPFARAEDDKVTQTQQPPPPPLPIEQQHSLWNAQLTEGWDSLYMYRGVNVLRGNSKYGSSLLWTDLNVTLNLTANDSLTADVWNAFGMSHSSYKETDASLTYTHTFGNLFASFGYEFYALTDSRQYANELQAKIGYNINVGSVVITPSVAYFFDLGPNVVTHGAEPCAASYLALRLDSSIPIYKDIISLTPWIAYGQNFRYNARDRGDGQGAFFDGANNIEVGIAMPIRINKYMTVSGYGAYSYNFDHLLGTEPSTFWGGAKVTFAF